MTHLRTDLSKIPDREMDEWVQDIVENTHYSDIKILRFKIDQAIQSHENDLPEQAQC